MEKKEINILYVDDEPNNLVSFKANFRKHYNIFTAESAALGRQILNDNKIQIVITDQRMPETTGVEFLESILPEHPDAIRILLTGYADIDTVIEAINKGQVYRYIMKPFNEAELKIVFNNAIELYDLREENKVLLKKLLTVNEQLEFMLRQKLLS